jgi:hypothetical protein
MINILMTHKGVKEDLNLNSDFINQLEVIQQAADKITTKEEYYNHTIAFYYKNDIITHVFFTVEHHANNIDGYILECFNSSLDEIAMYIADKRDCKKSIILDMLEV